MDLRNHCLLALTSLALGPSSFATTAANQAKLAVFEKLQEAGVNLCVVRIPVRDELYPSKDSHHEELSTELHPHTLTAHEGSDWLEEYGVPIIDLQDAYRDLARQRRVFAEDNFHLNGEAADVLATVLLEELQRLSIWPEDPEAKVVFMGECFAETLGDRIAGRLDEGDIRTLVKYSGGAQVHNHLFAFRDDYVKGTDLVVWIQTDRHFSNLAFPPLRTLSPGEADLAPQSVRAEALELPNLTHEEARTLPYPDALRAKHFRDLKTGEEFVGVGPLVKNRQLTLERKIRIQRNYRLSLVPLDDHYRENPDIARQCLIDETTDFDLPRYWIRGWYVLME